MKYDIAIVGMGPAGLAAALEASSQGKCVVVFTNRLNYVRQQRVRLEGYTIDYLKGLAGLAPQARIIKSKHPFLHDLDILQHASLKDIERFMYGHLKERKNVRIVEIETNQGENPLSISKSASEEGNHFFINIKRGEDPSHESYEFQHLIAADGAKHPTALMVQNTLKIPINYKEAENQGRYPYHFAAQLALKDGKSLKPGHDGGRLPAEAFRKLGWEEEFGPLAFFFSDLKRSKVSVSGELPQTIYQMKEGEEKKSEILKWVSECASELYGISPDAFEFKVPKKAANQAKTKLQSQTFEMSLKQSEQPYYALDEKHFFVQVGDARKAPFYPIQHGTNDGILFGIGAAWYLGKDGTFNSTAFSRLLEDRDSLVDKCIDPRERKYTKIRNTEKPLSKSHTEDHAGSKANENVALLKGAPQKYPHFWPDKTSKSILIQRLQAYVRLRQNNGEWIFWGFLYHEEDQQLEAARTLIRALGGDQKAIRNLSKHKSILTNGTLGELITEELKAMGSDKTVSDFIDSMVNQKSPGHGCA